MTWQLITLALALALNNSMAAVALGSSGMRRRRQFSTALLFALFEALMPVAGVLMGEGAARFIGTPARYVGVVVLVAAGVYSLIQVGQAGEDNQQKGVSGMRLLAMSVALSLDNLTVGFGLGMLHAPVGMAALVFGVVSLVMTLVGLEVGRFIGRAVNISAELITGIVLLATAGLMLLQ